MDMTLAAMGLMLVVGIILPDISEPLWVRHGVLAEEAHVAVVVEGS